MPRIAGKEDGLRVVFFLGMRGKQENLRPDYADALLTRRVPTLLHGGFSLSESSAITEYLEDVFPDTAVYPRQAQQKAARGRFRPGCAAA